MQHHHAEKIEQAKHILSDSRCPDSQKKFAEEKMRQVEARDQKTTSLLFKAPDPLLNHTNSLARYFLRDVFVWEPLRSHSAKVIQFLVCPNEKCNQRVGFMPMGTGEGKAPLKVKGILHHEDYFYLAYKRYKCNCCGEAFDNTDDRVLDNLPPSVRLSFPIITRRFLGISETFFETLYKSWLELGASRTADQLSKSYRTKFERRHLHFLACAYEREGKNQSHPEPLVGSNLTIPGMLPAMAKKEDEFLSKGGIRRTEKQVCRFNAASEIGRVPLSSIKGLGGKQRWRHDTSGTKVEIRTLIELVQAFVPFASDSHEVLSTEWINSIFACGTRDFTWYAFDENERVESLSTRRSRKKRGKEYAKKNLEDAKTILESALKCSVLSSVQDVLTALKEDREIEENNQKVRAAIRGDQDHAHSLGTESSEPDGRTVGPKPPEDFGCYATPTGYNGFHFNKNLVNDLASSIFRKRRPWLVQSLSSNYVDFLSIDTCWKPQKWFLRKLEGTNKFVPVYKSLVVGLTGAGLPAFMSFQHYFERHLELEPKLEQVREYMTRNYPGWHLPAAWTDKCCDNRRILQKVFGNTCLSLLDSFHWFQRFDDFISKDCPTYYSTLFKKDLEKALFLTGKDALAYIRDCGHGEEKVVLERIESLGLGDEEMSQIRIIPAGHNVLPRVQNVIDMYEKQDRENVLLNMRREVENEEQLGKALRDKALKLQRELTRKEVDAVINSLRPEKILPILFARDDVAKKSSFFVSQLKHVADGCLSDPVGCGKPLFYITPNKKVKPVRGTSKVENFFCVLGEKFKTNSRARCGPERADAILLETAEEDARRKRGALKGDPTFRFHSTEYRYQANSLYAPFGRVLFEDAIANRSNPDLVQLGAKFVPVDADESKTSAQTEVTAEIFLSLYEEQLVQIKKVEEQIAYASSQKLQLVVQPREARALGSLTTRQRKKDFEQPPLARDGRDIGRSFFPSLIRVLGRNSILDSKLLEFFGGDLVSGEVRKLANPTVAQNDKRIWTRVRETFERSATKETKLFFSTARRKVLEGKLIDTPIWRDVTRQLVSLLQGQTQRPCLPSPHVTDDELSKYLSYWKETVLGEYAVTGEAQETRKTLTDDEHGGLLYLFLLASTVQLESRIRVRMFITLDNKDLKEFDYPFLLPLTTSTLHEVRLYFSCMDGCVRPLYEVPATNKNKRAREAEWSALSRLFGPFTLDPSGKLERNCFFLMLKSEYVDTSSEEKITSAFNAIIHRLLSKNTEYIVGGAMQRLTYKTELDVRTFLSKSKEFLREAREEAVNLLNERRQSQNSAGEGPTLQNDEEDSFAEVEEEEDVEESDPLAPLFFASYDDLVEMTKGYLKVEEWDGIFSGQELGFSFFGEPLKVLRDPTESNAAVAPFKASDEQLVVLDETQILVSDLNFKSICKQCLADRESHNNRGFGKNCFQPLNAAEREAKLLRLRPCDFSKPEIAFKPDSRFHPEMAMAQRVKRLRIHNKTSSELVQTPLDPWDVMLRDVYRMNFSAWSWRGLVFNKREKDILQKLNALAKLNEFLHRSFPTLHSQDFARLLMDTSVQPTGHLNDVVIDTTCNIWLFRCISKRKWAFVNTGWCQSANPNPVLVHDDGGSIASLDLVLLPYNVGDFSHWVLFAALPGKKKIEFFDSMSGERSYLVDASIRVKTVLQTWFSDSGEWEVETVETVHQFNTYDCGVYTLANALATIQAERLEAHFQARPFRELIAIELVKFAAVFRVNGELMKNWAILPARKTRKEGKDTQYTPMPNDSAIKIDVD